MKKKQIENRVSQISTDEIDQVIDWQIWFDKDSKKPCGKENSYVVVAGLDEALPPIINKPDHIKRRKAVLIVFKGEK